ncbi:MAG: hypothetical protein A2915_00745 [Candidatus Yanofskybacteria bacterium RIFCSPLOWO2_01_FULL_41_34]|uniref:Uncharacterized protein n=1 Tax=Candidatus Yanofskybacteria bacterium RIFCSPHIGHO2_01_FULL_41_26 TaxID=1802661 RepID=A0A1F8EER3_9BACT|nr:MAG: hypothetical protein A2649_02775 [Candidatus Yanofskybacteria bacterium RIFCSPHIGHO2_01_FULL_41_26]OGN22423.1 MAG: hypothetical protein A2915_00745 [Candidatus Yanofskybacteria bacterium RIFCSPLOWO2_01_FULL_41_34]
MSINRNNQFLESVLNIIDSTTERFRQGEQVEQKDRIPLTDTVPLESNTWWRLNDVVCVYIDMKNSTQLSAQKQDKFTASIYQYFTGTAVKVLNEFGASYIDVRGDGAFGLFNSNRGYHALASAITFKTIVGFVMADEVVLPENMEKLSCHIGMDRKTVLVKRIGIRVMEGKTDKSNEVWAGKPVNMAAKLASIGGENDLIVSERVFDVFLKDNSESVLHTCGCPNDVKRKAWDTMNVQQDKNFDFSKAYRMTPVRWCEIHGKNFCQEILKLDE